MQGQRISSGSSYEALAGFSRAVIEGNRIHVSGTTGFDYATMTIDPDPVAQARQCFRNIEAVLRRAGASLADVIRVRYLLAEAALFEQLAPVFAEYLGPASPAATAMVVGLIDPRMRIEIEVTAVRTDPGTYSA